MRRLKTCSVVHQTSNSAKHTVLCSRPHHYTRQELLSYDSNATSRLHPQLFSWLKDLGIAHNVRKKSRRSKRGGRRKQRKICVIVGVHVPVSLGLVLPSPHFHSSLSSLEKTKCISHFHHTRWNQQYSLGHSSRMWSHTERQSHLHRCRETRHRFFCVRFQCTVSWTKR